MSSALMLAVAESIPLVVDVEPSFAGADSVSRTSGQRRRGVPTTCQLCPARCGVIGFVEEGKVAKIEGNPRHPNNQGSICAKGIAAVNLLYDPDRLLYPMKRIGNRGEGKWQRISWEEAYEELASRLKSLREQGHPEELVFQSGTAATPSLVSRFLQAFGTPNGFNWSPPGGENKAVALELTWGSSVEVSDVAHTRYILNFGSNPYEAHLFHLPLVKRLIEGRVDNFAKLVTFDVRLSATAGKSDEWIPLKAGTDGLVALAIASVIMQEGLYDHDFLTAWTNIPVSQLTRHLAQYTPEVAEVISGVPASDIRRIAREFATTKPATTLSGTGLSMHVNGMFNERCVALLNAITGNIDVLGGYCLPRKYELEEPNPKPPQPTQTTPLSSLEEAPFSRGIPLHTEMRFLKESGQKISVYMTYMRNPVYSNPDISLSAEVLKDENFIPYFVAVDTVLSESAALADLVLPDTTFLERWDLESPPSLEMVPLVSLRQPVVKPAGEAVPFQEVLIRLAKTIGGGLERYFEFDTPEEYLSRIVNKIEPLVQAGGMDYLKEFGVWYDPEAKPQYRSYENGGFGTPSKKFEIYSTVLLDNGFAPLPFFAPIAAHQNLPEDEFILTTFKWNVLTSGNANAKWVSEIVHTNPMWINRESAEALGLEKGDLVKLTSSQDSIVVEVRPTSGIHPRVVAISGHLGHRGLGRIARAERFVSNHPDTELIWWEEHGNGVNPNNLIAVLPATIGGGQAFHDTVVTLTRV